MKGIVHNQSALLIILFGNYFQKVKKINEKRKKQKVFFEKIRIIVEFFK
jgi:hypothetical protein